MMTMDYQIKLKNMFNSYPLEDILYFYNKLEEFPWYSLLNENRKYILIKIGLSLGWINFSELINLFNALKDFDYKKASDEILKIELIPQAKLIELAKDILDDKNYE